MAKATVAKAAKGPAQIVNSPSEPENLLQVFKVDETTSEADVMRADGLPGTRLEFDYVHFKRLADDFVAQLRPPSQKAYWLASAEYERRVRDSNIALHSIGVDPMSKILDRPRGTSNPLVRDEAIVSKALGPRWHVSWRVVGGQGDTMESIQEMGWRIIRRPTKEDKAAKKEPFAWSGEIWKIPDGTSDPTSGEAIYNVMVAIEQQRYDDSCKAMSMASHNAYSQHKQQFVEGAENISRDMLGGKEKVILHDLEEIRAEEHVMRGSPK